MELYKLYFKLLHRVDWIKIWREFNSYIYPDYYEELRVQMHNPVMRKAIEMNVKHGVGGRCSLFTP